MAKGKSNNMTSKLPAAKGVKQPFAGKKAAPFGKGKSPASAKVMKGKK